MKKHEPAVMAYGGERWPTKAKRRNGRARSYWRRVFKCPECGDTVARLENPLRGRRLVCRGGPRKQIQRIP